MATQTGTIKFTGKLGDVVGYRRKQKHCLRTRPETVRQTPATKRAASEFGVISKKGKLIRRSLLRQLDLRYDGTLVNRVNRALISGEQQLRASARDMHTGNATIAGKHNACPSAPGALQYLEGFSFNPYTSLRQLLPKAPVFTHNGVLQLAPQLLRSFGRATHLEIRAVGVRINFAERRVVNTDENGTIIELGDESFNGLELPLSVPGKGTLFILLQLRSGAMHKDVFLPSGDRRYMAADIIAVIPPAREYQLSTRKNALKTPAHRSSFNQLQKTHHGAITHQALQGPGTLHAPITWQAQLAEQHDTPLFPAAGTIDQTPHPNPLE